MTPKVSSKGSVLLVDDHPGVRRSISRLLKHECDFTLASDAREARQALKQQRFDLVLLDINLGPDMPTGLDCLSWLPETGHKGTVCMLTGYMSPELLHEALLLGADDYLSKAGGSEIRPEIARLVALGRFPQSQRLQYKTIADPGLLKSLRLNPNQINILTKMVEHGFPHDHELAEHLDLNAKALAERIARIEGRFGTSSRRQLIRYLEVLSGFVRKSQLEWGSGWVDRTSLIAGATVHHVPTGWI